HAESQALFEKILADGDCLTLKTMELSGKDLMAMGAPHGKVLGEVLAELLDMVLQHPETNKKEILSEKAQTLLKERGLL
ncbi:MAG: polynucleotide adenylyltransferase, partial [Anaerotignum sp.]|nr:polynucleotide adenylyltransferase [Anaerotignum sp.]